ncbi:MAG: hypothetical protein R3Y09_08585, partial [Clostridia bacterium]
MKKMLRIALAIVLTLNMTIAPAFATTAIGSSMSLEKTEGTVVIKNAADVTVTVREGGRLYSGYQIQTRAGYAWINLDDTKIIKLDRYSKVTINKTGTKLEVLLDSGSMYFDVSQPLQDDERLEIKTSTMYTSIRGTIGVVSTYLEEIYDETEDEVKLEKISSITLLEGKVDVTTKEEETQKTETIYASQKAIVSSISSDTTELEIEVINIEPSKALEENPFVAVEIAQDETVRERVEQATQEDLTEVLANSEQLLMEFESSVDQREQEIAEQITAEIAILEQEVAKQETTDSSRSSSDENDDDDDDVVTDDSTTDDDDVVTDDSGTTDDSDTSDTTGYCTVT